MEHPRVIVIQSDHTSKANPPRSYDKGSYIVVYSLFEQTVFQEPAYARLLTVKGLTGPVNVFTDFTQAQFVNGSLSGFLGVSGNNSNTHWVPLTSNSIPAFGYLTISAPDGSALGGKKVFSIYIEVAPLSWINGTQGNRRH